VKQQTRKVIAVSLEWVIITTLQMELVICIVTFMAGLPSVKAQLFMAAMSLLPTLANAIEFSRRWEERIKAAAEAIILLEAFGSLTLKLVNALEIKESAMVLAAPTD